ncbi:uncharacterized protein LOC132040644 isoform X5 [Lycium ferocissimum]|nr:uncharacterized protein LOC132040644 isoform X5 [Lycium ferocissimum]
MEILDIKQQYFLAQGVFLNGCMHWVSEMLSFLRFDLDSLSFRAMPSTVIPSGVLKRNIRYFGQSSGHLHLIEVYGFMSMSFDVLELETDYSKWFVKCRVDLSSLHIAYPLMLSEELDLLDVNRRTCNVVCVVVDDKEKTTRLLVSTPDVIVEYDTRRMTIKEVTSVENGKIPVMWEGVSVFECSRRLRICFHTSFMMSLMVQTETDNRILNRKLSKHSFPLFVHLSLTLNQSMSGERRPSLGEYIILEGLIVL